MTGPNVMPSVFKALSDPIRWDILRQFAGVEELAWSQLEATLAVSKPTISYHMKALAQAGLIDVRKRGRNTYYVLRQGAVEEMVDRLGVLAGVPSSATPGGDAAPTAAPVAAMPTW
ncbi:ArsR/SmtB family transcription factor [Trujillonella humicola]|uniref:ArsR/SmtB family transcription factor n=1 Tax=Trujillonella humicola TaxID=3383699 RepID=UPI003905F2D1